MKRTQFLKHLKGHGCVLDREGAKHSWWKNPANDAHSAVPRHREVKFNLAKQICRDLSIPEPESDN